MIARDFTKEDYPELVKLWNKRRRPILPISFLPPTGIVIEVCDVPVAFGFIVKTDTPFATICDLVTNIEASAQDRDVALDVLIRSLEDKAKESGYSAICGSTNHRGLMHRYGKLGFTTVDNDLSLFSRFICQQAD